MELELVSVLSTDNLMLPGLLYAPDNPTTKAAVWLHGMGDSGSFYNTVRLNALGAALAGKGIALLGLNNRGAHNRKDLHIADEKLPEAERYYLGGTHYELIRDCVKDIDGAAEFLQQRGFRELYLIGHSTGANKICVYDAHTNRNPFGKYVLAGPGDDTGLFYSELGEVRYYKALSYALKAVKEGSPLKTLPRYTGMHPFSAQAAADILDPDGDYNTFPFYEVTAKRLGKKPLFEEYKHILRPLLVVFGGNDEYAYTAGDAQAALDIFRNQTNPNITGKCSYQIVPEADHSFHGYEQQFAKVVAEWLAN